LSQYDLSLATLTEFDEALFLADSIVDLPQAPFIYSNINNIKKNVLNRV
jgi:hypothetical protein